MSEISFILKHLPELIALIKAIREAGRQYATDQKVKEDLSKLKVAFEKRDTAALNDIFNS